MKKFAIVITLILFTLLSGCYLSNQILASKMIAKYSENQSYVTLSGEIIECNEYNVTIKCEEIKEYVSYEDDICEYYIFSDKPLDLVVGDMVDFVTVPFHFYNGHELPIVELKLDDNVFLLNFEDGKENLTEWVKENFK